MRPLNGRDAPGLVKQLSSVFGIQAGRCYPTACRPAGIGSRSCNTFGVGYRRVDLWNEKVAFRVTARGTPRGAYMFDAEVDFSRLTPLRRGELGVYAKYENSPQMETRVTEPTMGPYSGSGAVPGEAGYRPCCGRNKMAPGE